MQSHFFFSKTSLFQTLLLNYLSKVILFVLYFLLFGLLYNFHSYFSISVKLLSELCYCIIIISIRIIT